MVVEEEPKGKQTKIGLIPYEWEVLEFSQVLDGPLRNGLTKPTSVRGKGVKMVNMGELFHYNRIKNAEMEKVPLTESERKTFLLQSGDLLFARQSLLLSGVGKCSIFLEDIEEVTFEGHLIRARINKEKANPFFLFYFFNSRMGRAIIEGYAEQVAASGIRGSDLQKVPVPVPPLHEQTAIASILSYLELRIELNLQMNKTLEAIGQAVFKRWFVDFEFPNEEGKPYKSSGGEMIYNQVSDKEIPKGWEIKPIDKIADFLNGLALQKFPARDGEECLPIVKIRELRQGITESSDKANLDVPEEYIVNDGDILFSWSGSLEVVIWGFGKGALNQHLFKVTSSKYPKWFFYYWVIHYLPEYRQIAVDKATTMGHIQRHHLTASQVAVPDNKTLERMDKVFAPILEKIGRIKVETRILSEIRDLTLLKLMSGKIRVPVTNENVEVL